MPKFPQLFTATVSVNGRPRTLITDGTHDEWKGRFMWVFGYWPEDHQLISIVPLEYDKCDTVSQEGK